MGRAVHVPQGGTCLYDDTSAVWQSMRILEAQIPLPAQQGICMPQPDMQADLYAKSCCVSSPSVTPVAPSTPMSAYISQKNHILRRVWS